MQGRDLLQQTHFTVWESVSGRPLYRSPTLRVDYDKSQLFCLMGCTTPQFWPPTAELSANGHGLLLSWPGFFDMFKPESFQGYLLYEELP